MGLFKSKKKKEAEETAAKEAAYMAACRERTRKEFFELTSDRTHMGDFIQSESFRGFKGVNINNSYYPEAYKNLRYLAETRPIIPATARYSGERIDLTKCKLSIYISRTKAHKTPAIMLYINDLFVGAYTMNTDKATAMVNALWNHRVTKAHVEIRFGTVDEKGTQWEYQVYLMTNGIIMKE